MDRDQLRAVQAPLKQRYREDPESALITLWANGSLEERQTPHGEAEKANDSPKITQNNFPNHRQKS